MKRIKFLIIDGSSLLSTSYYGNLPKELLYAKNPNDVKAAYSKILQTSDGRYTNGVFTFMKTLVNIIKNQNPTHLAIVWDRTRNTFRQKTLGFEGNYKANRKETPDPLKEQFMTVQNLLKGIVPQFASDMSDEFIYEADDFAGSLAKRFEDEIPVYLYTKDEDYLQLASNNTKIWLVTSKSDEMYKEYGLDPKEFQIPSGVFEYTLTTFSEVKGLKTPSEWIDAKGLMGDKSDNIPGVYGVGDKAAIPLLREYSSIENIYDLIESLDSKAEKELKAFFKESLGISRSPIANLLKEGSIILASGDKLLYKCISGELSDEMKLNMEIIKEKIGETRFPIEIITEGGVDKLQLEDVLGVELSAKESAFMSKELATIKTDIPQILNLKLEDLKLNIDKNELNTRLLDLEIKSLSLSF